MIITFRSRFVKITNINLFYALKKARQEQRQENRKIKLETLM